MKNYYIQELQRALEDHDTDYNLKVQFFGTSNNSKTLDLTPVCIDVLVEDLTRIKLEYLAKKRVGAS